MAKNLLLIHYEPGASEISTLESQLLANGYSIQVGTTDITSNKATQDIEWADTVLVLIGKDSNLSSSVNWNIRTANEYSKTIIGIYIPGGSQFNISNELESYASAIVCWKIEFILIAIGGEPIFLTPDCNERPAANKASSSTC